MASGCQLCFLDVIVCSLDFDENNTFWSCLSPVKTCYFIYEGLGGSMHVQVVHNEFPVTERSSPFYLFLANDFFPRNLYAYGGFEHYTLHSAGKTGNDHASYTGVPLATPILYVYRTEWLSHARVEYAGQRFLQYQISLDPENIMLQDAVPFSYGWSDCL